jgi:hypothetical protein
MKSGIATFLLNRSISAIIVLVVVVSITSFALYSYNVQRCAGINMEIRQDVENEIADKHITFPNAEARESYIQERIESELIARGMDYWV